MSRCLCRVDLVNEWTAEVDQATEGTGIDRGPGTELLMPKGQDSSLCCMMRLASGGVVPPERSSPPREL